MGGETLIIVQTSEEDEFFPSCTFQVTREEWKEIGIFLREHQEKAENLITFPCGCSENYNLWTSYQEAEVVEENPDDEDLSELDDYECKCFLEEVRALRGELEVSASPLTSNSAKDLIIKLETDENGFLLWKARGLIATPNFKAVTPDSFEVMEPRIAFIARYDGGGKLSHLTEEDLELLREEAISVVCQEEREAFVASGGKKERQVS